MIHGEIRMDIEEDIKLINNFVQNIENGFVTSSTISSWNPEKRIVKAIEHILAEREADKKKIDKLEKENKEILNSKIGIDLSYDDYIPKQKVKDEIEELRKMFKATTEGILQEYTVEEIIIKTNTFQKRGPRIVRAIRINSIEGMKESQCPVMALALFKD